MQHTYGHEKCVEYLNWNLEELTCRCMHGDSSKIDSKDMGCDGVDWINVAKNMDQL